MPIYEWEDELSGLRVEVFKDSLSKYQEPPLEEELAEDERGKKRKWKRFISGGIRVAKGDNWGGGKGSW